MSPETPSQEAARVSNLTITLKGELMEKGAIESKVLLQILEGTIGAIESMAGVANFKGPMMFYLRPPEMGSFAIDLQTIQVLAGGAVSMWPQMTGVKDVITNLIEYIRIRLALEGEELLPENIQKNHNGDITIKNKNGNTVYNDNRKITNFNLILDASGNPALNKNIDRLASSLERSTTADSLCFRTDNDDEILVPKSSVEYLKYEERFSERSDTVTGYIRKIDNKTSNGTVVILEDGKEKSVNFIVDIEDISKLEGVVNNLAIAEGNRSRVQLVGKKQFGKTGSLKKMIVHDVQLPDGRLDL